MPIPLIPALIGGALVGAGTSAVFGDRDDMLKNALIGGVLGGLTGGLGGAAGSASSGASGASQGVLSAATAPNVAAKAAIPEFSKVMAQKASQSLGQNAMQSLTPQALGSLTAGGTMSPAAAGINAGIVEAGKAPLFSRALQAVKDKPMETMQFANSLTPAPEEAPTIMPVAPIQQPQRAPVMSTEERLSQNVGDSPTFVPRGLFSEARSQLDEDELRRKLFV